MIRLSTKQRREVYSLSSLLLHLIVFVILLISLNSCTEENLQISNQMPATAQDLKGFDGCSVVLVLETGLRLQPVYPDRGGCDLAISNQLTTLEEFKLTNKHKSNDWL